MVPETDWLLTTDPKTLLQLVRGKASDRKLRLYACGITRYLWPLLHDVRSQQSVLTAERFADGLATEKEFEDARWAATEVLDSLPSGSSELYAADAACSCCWSDFHPWETEALGTAWGVVEQGQKAMAPGQSGLSVIVDLSDLARCIFHNPFRRIPMGEEALTSTVTALAQAIYAERAFDRLPILADALQDAGCENEDILAHCRGGGPHVRGCWVVDLVLGKT